MRLEDKIAGSYKKNISNNYNRPGLYNKIKRFMGKTVYAGIVGLSLMTYSAMPARSYAQESQKEVEQENFDDPTLFEASIEQYPDKWDVANERLEAKDFDTGWGDAESKWDYNRFHFIGKTRDFTKNLCLEVTTNKSEWGSEGDYNYVVFAGDPTQEDQNEGKFYGFGINAQTFGGEYVIGAFSKGVTNVIANGATSLIRKGESNDLAVIYNTGATYTDKKEREVTPGWNFYINNGKIESSRQVPDWSRCADDPNSRAECPIDPTNCRKIDGEVDPETGEQALHHFECEIDCAPWSDCNTLCPADPKTGDVITEECASFDPVNCTIDETRCPTISEYKFGGIPALNGYVGTMLWDSMGRNDRPFTSTTYFDNFLLEFDSDQGAGGRLEENLLAGNGGALAPDNPKIFIRGDANNDNLVNISDAVYLLESMYKNGPQLPCLDAGDSNDDGSLDIADPIHILLHKFNGLGIPYPNESSNGRDTLKGIDLTVDNLQDCESDPNFSWNR
ncbi:MAG: hypothetical protein Q7S27_02420 [Nanoarchaeota archaeon]|nr:hypothetical protein [Nanoarchaeota archaeon]